MGVTVIRDVGAGVGVAGGSGSANGAGVGVVVGDMDAVGLGAAASGGATADVGIVVEVEVGVWVGTRSFVALGSEQARAPVSKKAKTDATRNRRLGAKLRGANRVDRNKASNKTSSSYWRPHWTIKDTL